MRKFIKFIFYSLLFTIAGVYIVKDLDTFKATVEDFVNETLSVAKEKTNDLQSIIANGYLIKDSDIASLEDSEITSSNYTFDPTYYPYYEMLSSNEQTFYRQVYANVSSMNSTFVPISNVSKTEVANTVEAVYNDHPELFWLNTIYSYKYTAQGRIVQIILDFNDTALNIEVAKKNFDEQANEIILKAKQFSSDYEKEKYVHDTIIALADYDLDAPHNQSAYSALVNGRTVCAGYARAFQYIMMKLKIPTYYVTGYSNGEHAWNIVFLSDGYYNVDLTWDDTNPISYTYFNLTDSELSKTHTRSGLSESLVSCNATSYTSNHRSRQKSIISSYHKDYEDAYK